MPLQLPSFLRRRLRLYEARRALLAGAPEEALEHLSDASLALSEGAVRLREKALDVLCREAARRAAAGAAPSAARLLDVVGAQDPERARVWRQRLVDERASFEGSGRSSGSIPAAGSGVLGAIEALLRELRRERQARVDMQSSAVAERERERGGPHELISSVVASTEARMERSAVLRFHLAVDDAGEFLVTSGAELTLGHARAGRADLSFLADLDGRHATLRHSETFHGGFGWQIAAAGSQPIEVAGRSTAGEGSRLADGDLVRLSPLLSFVFRTPESGSASAVLELQHGAECEGSRRILLMRPGSAGALRMGGRADRLIQVRGLRQEIRLELAGAEIEFSSAAGLVVTSAREMPSGSGGSDPAPSTVRIACPPKERVDIRLACDAAGRPPFAFSIRPVEAPRRSSDGASRARDGFAGREDAGVG